MVKLSDPAVIESKLIMCAPTPEESADLTLLSQEPVDPLAIRMPVYEATVGSVTRMCCFAGGSVTGGSDGTFGIDDFQLTAYGVCMASMFLRLFPHETSATFAEIRLGPTPLITKICAVITTAPGGGIIFVGDMAGELDGKIPPLMNITEMLVDD